MPEGVEHAVSTFNAHLQLGESVTFFSAVVCAFCTALPGLLIQQALNGSAIL